MIGGLLTIPPPLSPVCVPRSLCLAQAVREAALLRQLCHPQQSGAEPLTGGPQGPDPPAPLQTGCMYLGGGEEAEAGGLHPPSPDLADASPSLSPHRVLPPGPPPSPCEETPAKRVPAAHKLNKGTCTEPGSVPVGLGGATGSGGGGHRLLWGRQGGVWGVPAPFWGVGVGGPGGAVWR